MVVLTSPPRDPEHNDIAPAMPVGSPPHAGGDMGLSIREIRAADTPPRRVNIEDDVTIVTPQSASTTLNGVNGSYVGIDIRQQVRIFTGLPPPQPLSAETITRPATLRVTAEGKESTLSMGDFTSTPISMRTVKAQQ